jgi:putative DNA primase/helicase
MNKRDLEKASKQPEVLQVHCENIPAELRELQQWDPWRYQQQDNGRWHETLLQVNGSAANATLRDTWTTFERAVEAYESRNFDGLGFVVTKNDPYCVVTLDDVFIGDSNRLEPWAASVLATFSPCYVETNATATGISVILRARKPELPLLGNDKIEVYDRENFLALTGTMLEDSCSTITEGQLQLDTLYAHWAGNTNPSAAPSANSSKTPDEIKVFTLAETTRAPAATIPSSAVVLDKPQALPVNQNDIPAELKAIGHWVNWRFSFLKGKWTKVPYNPQSKRAASTTDPETWSSFDTVFAAYQKGRYDGIGFVVCKDNNHADRFVVIDLDHSVEDGQLKPWAQQIVKELATYTELSPSGTGLRVIAYGRKPEGRCKSGDVEMYETRRYVSITGHRLETAPATIADCQAEINAVHTRHLSETTKKKITTSVSSAPSGNGSKHNLSNLEIISRAKAANPAFAKLWGGDSGDYNSASEADAALCSYLAFWTGPNVARIDQLFRQSGLMRDKWQREDYRQATINLALLDKTEFYQPRESLGRLKYTSGTTTSTKTKAKEKTEDEKEAGSVEVDDDPHRLAKLHAHAHYQRGEGFTLHLWRDEWFRHNGSCYRLVPHNDIRGEVAASVKKEFDRLNAIALTKWEQAGDDSVPLPVAKKVTTRLINDVLQALASILLVPSTTTIMPCWLAPTTTSSGENPSTWVPPFPAHEILATTNQLIHLASLVEGEDYSCPATCRFSSTNALDYAFDATAPAPARWLQFLQELWPSDRQAIQALQEWFGLCLLPITRLQKILMLVGPRRSGKGTIGRVLSRLVGPDNVASPTFGSLAGTFGLQPLLGKTVAIVGDAKLSERTDSAVIVERLLSISGEDKQSVQRKFLSAVETTLLTRFLLICNELPKLADSSGAFVGRLILLRLTESFFGREDTFLTTTLCQELPGILNWSILGWKRLTEQGRFTPVDSSANLLTAMEELASPITAFIRDRCTVMAGRVIAVQVLFTEWQNWCTNMGRAFSGTVQTFGRALRAAFPTIDDYRPRLDSGGRQRMYTGISLHEEGDPEPS